MGLAPLPSSRSDQNSTDLESGLFESNEAQSTSRETITLSDVFEAANAVKNPSVITKALIYFISGDLKITDTWVFVAFLLTLFLFSYTIYAFLLLLKFLLVKFLEICCQDCLKAMAAESQDW
ncbi:uncharacterized protein BO97DRAFT_423220 [Aspergillus homomorphus CBS 101889]|uniref:Uncharacterized protein n=1 Tax=Aspergillus homomorphus (strain CBS 101889) TaxID=1450537 RepID=A0A395I1A3_ASPHC|nr:hypothetical protein BO97DRAFT_423220 [Aspergillus homomorphus CBS 101889]RAL13840.1 hypothetical protein BO97DRAFT_423220 [Aspergillus homomorphus CBS 101889]